MAVLRYNGPHDVREVWGVSFPMGRTVEIDDPKLVAKALCLEGFERVDAEPVSAPDSDDYPANLEASDFDEIKIPVVGEGTIPENWREMHHSSRMKLARQLSGMDDISNDVAAVAVIEALLAAR